MDIDHAILLVGKGMMFPCGPAGCGVMPGGAGLVAFKSGDAEKEAAAAAFVAWMGAKKATEVLAAAE